MGIFQKLLSVGKENSLLEQSTVSVQVSPIVIEKKSNLIRRIYILVYVIIIVFPIYQALIDPDLLPGLALSIIWLITFLVAGLWIIKKSPWIAGIVWTIGLYIAIFLSFSQIIQGLFIPLLLLVSFLSAITLSLSGAFLSMGMVLLFVAILYSLQIKPFDSFVFNSAPQFFLGGICASVLASFIHRSIADELSSLANLYVNAITSLEKAREQQVNFEQVKEDLMLANRELIRLTGRLRGLTQTAESALKAKEEFVANVSHELRTPLNMILGFAETITNNPYLYGVRLPKKLLEDISIIRRNSHHLSELINDVLDFSQVESGRMALTRDWIDLNQLVEDAMEQVRPLFEAKKLYLRGSIPAVPSIGFYDETRIKEVIINLLSNAGRFTETGGVTVLLEKKEQNFIVAVTDTGTGIAPDQLELIFEPFRQVDGSIRRTHGGSGLGLAISKRFIEMHGGRMWVESSLGKGSTFYFSLPAEQQQENQVDNSQRWINPYNTFVPRTRAYQAPKQVATPRYIVFELSNSLTRILTRYMDQVEIISVSKQEDLVDQLITPTNAVIFNVSDLSTEVVRQVKEIIPIGTLLFTCFIPSTQDFAHQMGVIDYLIKPLSVKHVLSLLEAHVHEHGTILMVDDESETRQLISRIIESSGKEYQLLSASNGREALDILRQVVPDLLILDLVMPEVDGFTVLKAIQQNPRFDHLPVIVLSSRDPAGSPVITDSLRIIKPDGYSINDLISSIRLISDLFYPGSDTNSRERALTIPE